MSHTKKKHFHVNPYLAGQWVGNKLYVIDVNKSHYYLLPAEVGYTVLALSKGESVDQSDSPFNNVDDSVFEVLVKAEILTASPNKGKQKAKIEDVSMKDLKFSGFKQPILEQGAIEKHLVASGEGSSFTTSQQWEPTTTSDWNTSWY